MTATATLSPYTPVSAHDQWTCGCRWTLRRMRSGWRVVRECATASIVVTREAGESDRAAEQRAEALAEALNRVYGGPR